MTKAEKAIYKVSELNKLVSQLNKVGKRKEFGKKSETGRPTNESKSS